MKKLFITLFLAWAGYGACAQNLVPNGSFEEYTTCPTYLGYPQYATGWQGILSSDYFHRCQSNLTAGVPLNEVGWQEPADGDGYVGMITGDFGASWYREMVVIQLEEPLQANVPICVSFRMAVGGFGSSSGSSALYTAPGTGVKFYNQIPIVDQSYVPSNTPAVFMDVLPTDTSIWYYVSGIYVPDSDYTYLVIGNFSSEWETMAQQLDTTGFGSSAYSYSFVDDVRASFDLQFCEATAIKEYPTYRQVRAYPNPVSEELWLTLDCAPKGLIRWSLHDLSGARMSEGSSATEESRFRIDSSSFPAGYFLLHLRDDTGAYAPIRLITISP